MSWILKRNPLGKEERTSRISLDSISTELLIWQTMIESKTSSLTMMSKRKASMGNPTKREGPTTKDRSKGLNKYE